MKNFKEYVEEGSINKATVKFTHDKINKEFKAVKKSFLYLEKFVNSKKFSQQIESYDEYQRMHLIKMVSELRENLVSGMRTSHIDYVPSSKSTKEKIKRQSRLPKSDKPKMMRFDN